MNSALRVVCVGYSILMSIALAMNGSKWAFFPSSKFETYGISTSPENVLGINMIKTDIGGSLLSMFVMSLLFFLAENGRQQWGPPIMLSSAMCGTVRLVSLFVDGYDPVGIIGVVMELMWPIVIWGLLNDTQDNQAAKKNN